MPYRSPGFVVSRHSQRPFLSSPLSRYSQLYHDMPSQTIRLSRYRDCIVTHFPKPVKPSSITIQNLYRDTLPSGQPLFSVTIQQGVSRHNPQPFKPPPIATQFLPAKLNTQNSYVTIQFPLHRDTVWAVAQLIRHRFFFFVFHTFFFFISATGK